ncbi:MAG: Pvc16 family protein [Cyanobacteria bacterium P01_G01_bin.54]
MPSALRSLAGFCRETLWQTMLDTALTFFKDELSNYIRIKTDGQKEDLVQFPEIQLPKELIMQNNAITMLLVSLEEERTFRSGAVRPPALSRVNSDARVPHLDINAHVLFVANFKDYTEGLKILSLILRFFQSYRLFSQKNFPSLQPDVDQISMELINLTYQEQSELWRSLEMPCSPSVLYKVRVLVFEDDALDSVDLAPAMGAIATELSGR